MVKSGRTVCNGGGVPGASESYYIIVRESTWDDVDFVHHMVGS